MRANYCLCNLVFNKESLCARYCERTFSSNTMCMSQCIRALASWHLLDDTFAAAAMCLVQERIKSCCKLCHGTARWCKDNCAVAEIGYHSRNTANTSLRLPHRNISTISKIHLLSRIRSNEGLSEISQAALTRHLRYLSYSSGSILLRSR
jgi:hypothetical protein